ncbi:MAG: hypothetical protein K8H90_06290, partial [Thermoanaerobaculia bacterium]|nr:hypothetical protein [Thermoanaerobaculia bacterium]
MARSLVQLVCLAQIGTALLERLASSAEGAFRAVGTIVLAALSGWTVAILLGLFGELRAPLFALIVALLASVLGVAAARGRAAEEPRSAGPSRGRDRVAVALAFAICAATLGHDLRAARYQAPGAALYDDVSYHLPAALLWDRTGDLRMLRFEFGDPSTCFYPIGGELASWIVLAGTPGSDFLARWSQLPAGLGILFAVWALARCAGATAWGALLALLLTLSVPRLYPELALSAGNDVWAAFFALAALLAAAPVPDSRARAGRWILFAASLGALVGTKYLTLAWLPWLAGAAAVSGALAPVLRGAGPDRLRVAALGLAVILGGGGFIYARNLATAGNPVFPQPVAVAGIDLLPGWRATGMAERIEREGHGTWDLGAFVDAPQLLGAVWGSALLPVAA